MQRILFLLFAAVAICVQTANASTSWGATLADCAPYAVSFGSIDFVTAGSLTLTGTNPAVERDSTLGTAVYNPSSTALTTRSSSSCKASVQSLWDATKVETHGVSGIYTCTETIDGLSGTNDIGGRTLTPGVYCLWNTDAAYGLTFTSTVILNDGGQSDAEFVFMTTVGIRSDADVQWITTSGNPPSVLWLLSDADTGGTGECTIGSGTNWHIPGTIVFGCGVVSIGAVTVDAGQVLDSGTHVLSIPDSTIISWDAPSAPIPDWNDYLPPVCASIIVTASNLLPASTTATLTVDDGFVRFVSQDPGVTLVSPLAQPAPYECDYTVLTSSFSTLYPCTYSGAWNGVPGLPTIGPGVYCISDPVDSFVAITLDAGGDPDARFVFTGTNFKFRTDLVLGNGARPGNILWNVGSLYAYGYLAGVYVGYSTLYLFDATFEGRYLVRIREVTVDGSSTILWPYATPAPKCAAPTNSSCGGYTEWYSTFTCNTVDCNSGYSLTTNDGPLTCNQNSSLTGGPQTCTMNSIDTYVPPIVPQPEDQAGGPTEADVVVVSIDTFYVNETAFTEAVNNEIGVICNISTDAFVVTGITPVAGSQIVIQISMSLTAAQILQQFVDSGIAANFPGVFPIFQTTTQILVQPVIDPRAPLPYSTGFDLSCRNGTNCRGRGQCYHGLCGCTVDADGFCLPHTMSIDTEPMICAGGAYRNISESAQFGDACVTQTTTVNTTTYNFTCEQHHPDYVNVFPGRQFCQNKHYPLYVDRFRFTGILGNPYAPNTTGGVQVFTLTSAYTMVELVQRYRRMDTGVVEAPVYISNFYDNRPPIYSHAWGIASFRLFYSSINSTVLLTRLEILDAIEPQREYYNSNQRYPYGNLPAGAEAYRKDAWACIKYFVYNPDTRACEPGCNNTMIGTDCTVPTTSVVFDPLTMWYLKYDGTAKCKPGYVFAVTKKCVLLDMSVVSSSRSSSTVLDSKWFWVAFSLILFGVTLVALVVFWRTRTRVKPEEMTEIDHVDIQSKPPSIVETHDDGRDGLVIATGSSTARAPALRLSRK